MPDSSRRAELLLRQVRDVARDFLGAELGVARHHHQLLDVDRGVAVVGDDALADEDRVLEVVAVPGHERDQHVLAERELADVGRGAVGDDVLGLDLVAALDDRALVDVRVLVRALVLDQVVDVDADLARHRLLVVDADDDAVGVDVVDHAAAAWRRRRCPSPSRRRARRRCRRAPSRGAASARPGAACSRPSARGSRRRARGTAPARPRPRRSASARRPCTGCARPRSAPIRRCRAPRPARRSACLRCRASRWPARSRTCLPRWPTGSRSGSSPCRRPRGGTASRGSRTR